LRGKTSRISLEALTMAFTNVLKKEMKEVVKEVVKEKAIVEEIRVRDR
jgi:(2Fe-2S) ferredoxin